MDPEMTQCCICGFVGPDSVRLAAGCICPKCLELISATEVDDPKYGFFVAKLKELWQAG